MTATMRPDNSQDLADKRKLYVLVREDLSPGLLTAQACHAVAEFFLAKGWSGRLWSEDPEGGYLIVLGVPNEEALKGWVEILRGEKVDQASFHEPDLDGALTAVCFHPHPSLNGLVAGLPLALRPKGSLRSRAKAWVGVRAAAWGRAF